MADIVQAQIIDEEIVTPSADPVAHNMPGGGAVESVNGKTGAVVLTADDVGAVAEETFNTAMEGKQDKLTTGAGAEIKDGVLSATSLGLTSATVGQIAKISAVGGNGVPTAWEPVDMPSGGGGKPMELIRKIEISEGVTEIRLNTDDAGNQIALTEAKIYVKTYFGDDVNNTGMLTFGFHSNQNGSTTGHNWPVLLKSENIKSNNSARYKACAVVHAYQPDYAIDGNVRWIADIWHASTATSAAAQQVRRMDFAVWGAYETHVMDAIRHIKIVASSAMLVGTEVWVYGVKA